MKALYLAATLCCFLLGAGAPQLAHAQTEAVDREAVAEELLDLSRAWSDAVASGDMEAVLSYWADDAVMMAPGQPPIRGKAAIRDYLMATGDIPGFRIRWEPLEAHVSASGDLAYLIERNEITVTDSTGAPVTEYNKVVTVWERQEDGSWKNVVDMWNADPTPWE